MWLESSIVRHIRQQSSEWEQWAEERNLEAVDAVELDGEVDGRHVEPVAQRRVRGRRRVQERRDEVRVAALDRHVQRRVALAVLRVHELLEVRRHCATQHGTHSCDIQYEQYSTASYSALYTTIK